MATIPQFKRSKRRRGMSDRDAGNIAVGVCAPGGERYMSGERIGTIRTALGEVPVLVWAKR